MGEDLPACDEAPVLVIQLVPTPIAFWHRS